MPRTGGYHRLRPNEDRVMQAVWDALRRAQILLSARQLAERSQASVWTVRNFLKRWEREGLAIRDGAVGRDSVQRYSPCLWRIGRRVGSIAPILHGHRDTGVGFTDPN